MPVSGSASWRVDWLVWIMAASTLCLALKGPEWLLPSVAASAALAALAIGTRWLVDRGERFRRWQGWIEGEIRARVGPDDECYYEVQMSDGWSTVWIVWSRPARTQVILRYPDLPWGAVAVADDARRVSPSGTGTRAVHVVTYRPGLPPFEEPFEGQIGSATLRRARGGGALVLDHAALTSWGRQVDRGLVLEETIRGAPAYAIHISPRPTDASSAELGRERIT